MATRWRVLPLLLAAQASAQTVLYGVRANGDLIRIDRATGAGVLVGNSGVQADAAGAYIFEYNWTGTYVEYILTAGGTGAHANEILGVDRSTGTGTVFQTVTGFPAGYGIRAMAGWYVVLLQPIDPTSSSLVAVIDSSAWAVTILGPTGRTDLTSIAMSPAGAFYAIGTAGGGTLYAVSATGEATPVGGGGFAGDDQALEFMPDGTLVSCGANLRVVDPATGAATLIGPTGFTGIRDLAWIRVCYANCHHGAQPPILSILDFSCFLNRFASGDPWANCDLSTTPPVLNVADFVCFMNSFFSEAGCYP